MPAMQRKALKHGRLASWQEAALREAGFEFSGKAAAAKRAAWDVGACHAVSSAEAASESCRGGLLEWDLVECPVCNSGDGEDSMILCDACSAGQPFPAR